MMTIHYMDGGPFETRTPSGRLALVLGYDDEVKLFVYAYPGKAIPRAFVAGRREACDFDPPPPIPAAARKPQIGEVWIGKGPGAPAIFLAFIDEDDEAFLSILGTDNSWNWYFPDDFARPATPEEAEPFRPVLEGLKRSLGEA